MSAGKNSLNLSFKKEKKYTSLFFVEYWNLIFVIVLCPFFRWLNFLVVNFIDTRPPGFTYMVKLNNANFNVGLLIPK